MQQRHPQLGHRIATFGYGAWQTRGNVLVGVIGILFFGGMALLSWQADAGWPSLVFLFFVALSLVAVGIGLAFWNQAGRAVLSLYAGGVLVLADETPDLPLRWGTFVAQNAGWLSFGGFRLLTVDGRRYEFAFIQHERALLNVLQVMIALHEIDARAKDDKDAALWVFQHRDPAKTITAYVRGLHVGQHWLDYGTVTDVVIEDGAQTLRVKRLGKPDVRLDADVDGFALLQALIEREILDLHLVPKAKQRMQMQELTFSHAVITPSGVRAPDNNFWAWPKLKEALITLNKGDAAAAAALRPMGWFAEQIGAPDVLLFMALVISYIGVDFAQDLTAETLLLRLRYYRNR